MSDLKSPTEIPPILFEVARLGVSARVWEEHQKACEELFQLAPINSGPAGRVRHPSRRRFAAWVKTWRHYEAIAASLNAAPDEMLSATLSGFRQQAAQALLAGNHRMFTGIARFLRGGAPDDEFPAIAPYICEALRFLMDEWQTSPKARRLLISKAAVEERAASILADERVKNEPASRKERLRKRQIELIREQTNWAREFRRLGLMSLPEAKRGRKAKKKVLYV
jgi:hypothetical protein